MYFARFCFPHPELQHQVDEVPAVQTNGSISYTVWQAEQRKSSK